MSQRTCEAQTLQENGERGTCGQPAFGLFFDTPHCFFHLLEVTRTRTRPLPILPLGSK